MPLAKLESILVAVGEMLNLRDRLGSKLANLRAAPDFGVDCAAREACASHGNGVDAREAAVLAEAKAPTELGVAARVPT